MRLALRSLCSSTTVSARIIMLEYFFFTKISLGLLSIITIGICFLILTHRRKKREELLVGTEDDLMDPPQPRRFPVIGHLHLLAGYEIPYQAFAVLRRKYGDIVRLQLGGVKSLMVSGHKSIREILVTKGHHFDSRPNFQRYSMLFSGDKENCEYIKVSVENLGYVTVYF